MVVIDSESFFAGRDHIKFSVSVEIGYGEVNSQSLCGSHGAEFNDVFGETLAGPFEDIPAVGVLVSAIAMRMPAESFTGDELSLSIAINVDPLQIVILAVVRIDFVFGPRSLACLTDLL